MILIIMFAVIVCACIGVAIWANGVYERDGIMFVSATVAVLFGVALFTCGFVAIIINSPHNHLSAKIEYEEKVASLNATYTILMSADDSYAKYTGIQQYNLEVSEFKTDIIKTQKGIANPWISWMYNYEYKNFDADAVSYIELGD